jgi:predicted Rossmann fold nucleotide-binding protein DprA/Smf involved in DNA uptake
LLGVSANDLQTRLDLPQEDADRLAALLDRGGSLAMELERLESLGIWVLTRADDAYPVRYRERLKHNAPAVLFGCGPMALLGKKGLAVVGSRDAGEVAQQAAVFAGKACAACELVIYSGGARGVDGLAMTAAWENGGRAVGILADSLEKAIRAPQARDALEDGHLALVTPYTPKAGFNVGMAMGRNKLIYTLADYALVVSSDADKGGTWGGATEAMKAAWVPVFVCDGMGLPEGNRKLIQRGATPFPVPFPQAQGELGRWLAEQSPRRLPEQSLFANE